MSRNNSYKMGLTLGIGKIEGLEEVGKLLREMPIELRDKVARKAIKEALEPLLAEVERRAPLGETGNLKASFKISNPKPKRNLDPWGSVITRAPHAHLVEFGHRLVEGKGSGARQIGTVPEKPFMRPALDGKVSEVGSRIADALRFWIEKLESKNANKLGQS